MLGDSLLTKGGPKPTGDVLAGKKLVGLYFSASWCGPCKRFTPLLQQIYEARKAKADDFEVVFLSACETAPEMEAYYDHMPWTAVQFGLSQGEIGTRGVGFVRKKKREAGMQQGILGAKFNIEFVPRLVLLDAASGETLLESAHDETAWVPLADSGRPDLESLWAEIAGI